MSLYGNGGSKKVAFQSKTSNRRKRVKGISLNHFALPSHSPPLSTPRLKSFLRHLQDISLEQSTKDGYLSSRKNWHRFVKIHNLPTVPTSYSIALYVAYLASLGHSSIPQALSALANEYKPLLPNWDKIREDADTPSLIRSVRKHQARLVKQAEPISVVDVVLACNAALDSISNPYDSLLAAFILAVSFCGIMRLGESVAPLKQSYFRPAKYPPRSSFSVTDSEIRFRLPYSKSDPTFTGGIIVIRKELVPAAIPIFDIARAFIKVRDDRFPPNSPDPNPLLFASHTGRLLPRQQIVDLLKSVGSYSGHSLRAGGATYLAKIGVERKMIQLIGRWRSQAYEQYIRTHPAILAALAARALGEEDWKE